MLSPTVGQLAKVLSLLLVGPGSIPRLGFGGGFPHLFYASRKEKKTKKKTEQQYVMEQPHLETVLYTNCICSQLVSIYTDLSILYI